MKTAKQLKQEVKQKEYDDYEIRYDYLNSLVDKLESYLKNPSEIIKCVGIKYVNNKKPLHEKEIKYLKQKGYKLTKPTGEKVLVLSL